MTPNPEQSERLLALAARCEAAEGPDRELDIAVFHATEQGFIADGWDHLYPLYTASLDAAMTLIPADLFPTIDFVTKRVWIRDAKGFDVAWGSAHGFAATVTLSICAAALRAHAGDGA